MERLLYYGFMIVEEGYVLHKVCACWRLKVARINQMRSEQDARSQSGAHLMSLAVGTAIRRCVAIMRRSY